MARGYIRKRGERSWQLAYDAPRGADGKRRQRYETVRGTKRQAEARLTQILDSMRTDRYFEPTRQTVGEHLDRFLADYVAVNCRPQTERGYGNLIRGHLRPHLGHIPLARLSARDVQGYYADSTPSVNPLGEAATAYRHARGGGHPVVWRGTPLGGIHTLRQPPWGRPPQPTVMPAEGDLCVTPPVGDSVAEMASISSGEPPTLDSRAGGNPGLGSGNDGCAKVSGIGHPVVWGHSSREVSTPSVNLLGEASISCVNLPGEASTPCAKLSLRDALIHYRNFMNQSVRKVLTRHED